MRTIWALKAEFQRERDNTGKGGKDKTPHRPGCTIGPTLEGGQRAAVAAGGRFLS
jgi:hypothetical protein